MKILINRNYNSLLRFVLVFCALVANVFGQDAETVETLTRKIEADPKAAENYLARAGLYSDMAADKESPANLPLIARAVADYTAYLRLKPNDAQVLRMRGLARRDLFVEANPFAAEDTRRSFQLNPKDLEARDELRVYDREYKKFYSSAQCRRARVKKGFQGNAADEPLTALAESLEAEMTEDATVALKFLACGANPNYIYPQTGTPEFSDFTYYRIEHLIGLLEAGANPNIADRQGNTPLMSSLNGVVKRGEKIDEAMIERFKIALDYGANPNARNRRGQSVLSFAQKTKNERLINLLIKRGAK